MSDLVIEEHLQYLIDLSLIDGPKEEEFETLTEWIEKTIRLKKQGKISIRQIRKLWDLCGEAFSTKTIQGLLVRKPYGYAGDFEIIDKIHTKWCSPFPHLKQWDLYLHSTAAPKAVRNRKEIFHKQILSLQQSIGNTTKVLNVGSGPGRDLYEYFIKVEPNGIIFDCVDMDKKAIQYARNINREFNQHINWHCCNIFRFNPSETYDLIWSAGLFDYLSDKQFIFLLKRFYKMTAKTGYITIGNFSTRNPTQANMEFGEWFVEHRSENKLRKLARGAGVPEECISISCEPLGVNLFLNINKNI
jgi:SAM-dependent methyltransferase